MARLCAAAGTDDQNPARFAPYCWAWPGGMIPIMRTLAFVFLCTFGALAQQSTPSYDSRIGVNALVREDLFAGFLSDDMAAFERGEKTIAQLLDQRPES